MSIGELTLFVNIAGAIICASHHSPSYASDQYYGEHDWNQPFTFAHWRITSFLLVGI
jgi:hypothetical protein